MRINPGFNELMGTDERDDCNKSFPKEFFEYREKWEKYPKEDIVGDFPLHVDIESTNACNLRCVMCGRNFMKEKIGFMEWSLFKKIIDECSENNLPSIKLNYRGEPLMHPKIVDMVRYAKEKGILEVQFNTNGLLLTEELSRKLIEAGLDRIIFSFDGAKKETYERIRTGSSYDRVLKNIRDFVRIRNEMGGKRPCVRVQMVLMEDTEKELDEYIKMWKNVANRIGLIKRRERDPNAREIGNENRFPCPQIWQRMMICWDGEVRMCCGDWHGKYIIGDARRDSLKDLWLGEKYSFAREMHRQGKYDKVPPCRTCEINVR